MNIQNLDTIPLHLISQFLDAYSLCQLAMVSKSMQLDADSTESWETLPHYRTRKELVRKHVTEIACEYERSNIALRDALIAFDHSLHELSLSANLRAQGKIFQSEDNTPWQLMYCGSNNSYYYSKSEAVRSWKNFEPLRWDFLMDKRDEERVYCEKWVRIAGVNKIYEFKQLRGENSVI